MIYLSVYLLVGLFNLIFKYPSIKLLTDFVRDGNSEGLERHFGIRPSVLKDPDWSLGLYLFLTMFYLVLWPIPLLHKIFR